MTTPLVQVDRATIGHLVVATIIIYVMWVILQVSSSSCFIAFASCFFLLFLLIMLDFYKLRRSFRGFCLDSFLNFRVMCRNLCRLLLY